MPAIFANRSPNDPMLTPRTRSPGDRVLTTAASRPPDPAVEIIATSEVVPKYGFIPSRMRASIAANSGPRWLIIWRAPAVRTLAGSAVGPGIRRFGSKRSTAEAPGVTACVGRWSRAMVPQARGTDGPDARWTRRELGGTVRQGGAKAAHQAWRSNAEALPGVMNLMPRRT